MKQKVSWMLNSSQARMHLFVVVVTVLTCGLTLSSCSDNDDNHDEDPMLQKKVSQVSVYEKQDDNYFISKTNSYTYNDQGKIIQKKLFFYVSGIARLQESYDFSYSERLINVINKTYPNDTNHKAVINDTDYELDDKGRIVRGTDYSYHEGETRENSDEPEISKFSYNEQGQLTTYEFGDIYCVLEWQGTELHKLSRYQNGLPMVIITYNPSEQETGKMIPVGISSGSFDWLMHLGYLGQRPRYLPARIIQEFYNTDGQLITRQEDHFDYEVTFGLVTSYNTVHNFDLILFNKQITSNNRNFIVWE
jgi:hypothetical protein